MQYSFLYITEIMRGIIKNTASSILEISFRGEFLKTRKEDVLTFFRDLKLHSRLGKSVERGIHVALYFCLKF